MMKKPLTLMAVLMLFVNAFAQSGNFTVTTPCNSYNRGEFIWNFTWTKLTSPHPGIKLSYTLRPGNTFRLGSRTFTRSEVGLTDADIRNVSVTSNFSFDVYYKGSKVGTVGTGKYLSSSGYSGWLDVTGGYPMFINGLTYEEAKTIFLSEIEVKNFRFQENAGVEFQFSDNLLAKLKQQEEANKPQDNSQKKSEAQKSSSGSNSQSQSTGTGSSGSSSNSNNYGQQVYNQTLENNKQIQQTSEKLNQQVTNFANDIGNAVNEQRHREAEQATAEMERRQAEWERQIDAEAKIDREESKRRYEAYKQSGFYKTDVEYQELEADEQQWRDWITACKDGGKVALQNFVDKYTETTFGKKAYVLFVRKWELLESGTGTFIPSQLYTATSYNNWNLAKALLAKGVKATTYFKDTLGTYHSPLQQLFTPRYKTGEALKYLESDRDDLFRQLVINGADANMPWEAKIYAGEVHGYNYVIDLIIGNDYNGQNLEWLLQNNKLTQKTIQYMFVKLAAYDADAFAKGVKDAYETSCKLHGDLQHKTNAYDLFYIEMAKLVKYGAPLSGTFPHPDYRNKKICLTPQDHHRESDVFYPELYAVWLNVGDINSFLNFQNEILNRASEVDRIYLYKLAQTCIESDGTRTDALGNRYDFKPLLKRIIQAGASPTAKEIEWKGSFYSMISLAKEKNPSLVDFIKNSK